MSSRTEIAAALSTVEGLTAYPYRTADISPGTAFLRLERIDYPNDFGGINHWNVVLILPQDGGDAAEKYLEDKLPLLLEALRGHLPVTSVQPTRLDILGVGVLPCVFINGHREAD